MKQDREHLRILSICHCIYAALSGLGSLFVGGLYLFMGTIFFSVPTGAGNPPGPPPEFGWMMVILGSGILLFGLAVTVCVALAGYYLSRFRRRIFCFVVAGLVCINVPLGTVLGVFTIIVLVRPSVRDLFEGLISPEPEYQVDPEDLPDDRWPTDPAHAEHVRGPRRP
jgi:hypothetical protein